MRSSVPSPLEAFASEPARVARRQWYVRLFGPFGLVGPDGSNATPSGRKGRALLAYLIRVDGATVPRDRLASLLWSERGEDQARASMRQTFYEMRGLTMGEDALIHVDRHGARAVIDRLASDFQRLRDAAESADAPALTALLGDRPAELLADLDGVDPAFDEWLAAERVRCDHERRRIALAAGEHALAMRDDAGAERIARRLLSCNPADEAAARLAMEASHRLGDRDAVRQTFKQVGDALRCELAVEPADETVAAYERLMIAEMPSREIRAGAATIAANEALPDDRAEPLVAEPASAQAGAPVRRRGALAIAGVVAVIGVAALLWGTSMRETTSRTLEVEPLRAAVTDSPALALRVGLSGDLARLMVGNDDTLRVVDATRRWTGSSRDTFIVDGEARSDGGLIHATLHLSHDTHGPILWAQTFVRPIGEVDALREEMASKLGDVAICALGHTNPKASTFTTEAMRVMLGACDQKHLMKTDETAKLFEQVVALRPDFAHGWAMLAVSRQYSALDRPGDAAALEAEAERDAQRALALDPHDGEAYYARAIRLRGIDQWQNQMDILEHGHAIDPTNGQIDDAIAGDLEHVGRWQEAAAFRQQAVDADPFGVFKAASRARLMGFSGDIADAMTAILEGRKRFGNHRAIAYADFEFSALLGDPRRAQAMLDDAGRGFALRPQRVALWSSLIADRIAPTPENDAKVDAAIREAEQASAGGNSASIIEALARRDRVDETYAFIERLMLHDDLATDVLFDVLTKSLRDDPRFMTVAARAHLIPIWEKTGHWPDFCAEPGLGYDCKAEARRAMSPDARPLVTAG